MTKNVVVFLAENQVARNRPSVLRSSSSDDRKVSPLIDLVGTTFKQVITPKAVEALQATALSAYKTMYLASAVHQVAKSTVIVEPISKAPDTLPSSEEMKSPLHASSPKTEKSKGRFIEVTPKTDLTGVKHGDPFSGRCEQSKVRTIFVDPKTDKERNVRLIEPTPKTDLLPITLRERDKPRYIFINFNYDRSKQDDVSLTFGEHSRTQSPKVTRDNSKLLEPSPKTEFIDIPSSNNDKKSKLMNATPRTDKTKNPKSTGAIDSPAKAERRSSPRAEKLGTKLLKSKEIDHSLKIEKSGIVLQLEQQQQPTVEKVPCADMSPKVDKGTIFQPDAERLRCARGLLNNTKLERDKSIWGEPMSGGERTFMQTNKSDFVNSGLQQAKEVNPTLQVSLNEPKALNRTELSKKSSPRKSLLQAKGEFFKIEFSFKNSLFY